MKIRTKNQRVQSYTAPERGVTDEIIEKHRARISRVGRALKEAGLRMGSVAGIADKVIGK